MFRRVWLHVSLVDARSCMEEEGVAAGSAAGWQSRRGQDLVVCFAWQLWGGCMHGRGLVCCGFLRASSVGSYHRAWLVHTKRRATDRKRARWHGSEAEQSNAKKQASKQACKQSKATPRNAKQRHAGTCACVRAQARKQAKQSNATQRKQARKQSKATPRDAKQRHTWVRACVHVCIPFVHTCARA